MQTLNISISKAQLDGFQVTLEDNMPQVTATISLLTAGGKKVTSYSIASNHWQDNLKFQVPLEMIPPILSIAEALEKIVTDHCQSTALKLEVK